MTDFEKRCYGMTEADIREEYMNSITAKFSGLEMVAMGALSDAQELMTFGNDQVLWASCRYAQRSIHPVQYNPRSSNSCPDHKTE